MLSKSRQDASAPDLAAFDDLYVAVAEDPHHTVLINDRNIHKHITLLGSLDAVNTSSLRENPFPLQTISSATNPKFANFMTVRDLDPTKEEGLIYVLYLIIKASVMLQCLSPHLSFVLTLLAFQRFIPGELLAALGKALDFRHVRSYSCTRLSSRSAHTLTEILTLI